MFTPRQAVSQTARDILGPAAVQSIENQPSARLIVDAPISEALAEGRVYIQYRAENLRIVPVFGAAALGVTPRIGHVHVTVDDLPWHWADASGEQLILTGLPVGSHRVRLELVNAAHQTLDEATVEFFVPTQAIPAARAPLPAALG